MSLPALLDYWAAYTWLFVWMRPWDHVVNGSVWDSYEHNNACACMKIEWKSSLYQWTSAGLYTQEYMLSYCADSASYCMLILTCARMITSGWIYMCEACAARPHYLHCASLLLCLTVIFSVDCRFNSSRAARCTIHTLAVRRNTSADQHPFSGQIT